jgi:LysM repeat protein
MNKVLRDLKRWATHASILCISPQEMYRYSYPLIETGVFTRDFKKVSFAQNAAFIDWYAASGAKGGAKKWLKNGLLQKNKVRLNAKGCRKKEQLISSAIKNAYEKVVNAQDSVLIIPNYITDLSDSKEKKTDGRLLNDKPKRIIHQVGRGQNLYRISLAYDVQPEDIMRWNKLTNDQLNTGQRLIIFKDNKRKDIPAIPKIDQNHKSNKRVFHRVRSGQSLYSIAKKYKTTIASIKELNKLKSNTIGIGQLLRVK